MIFEEALKAMREGKKIINPYMEKDVYLMACYVGISFIEESFEEKKKRGMSIVLMRGDRQHEDMLPLANQKKDPWYKPECGRNDLHAYPHLNLFLIMRDDWEIVT